MTTRNRMLAITGTACLALSACAMELTSDQLAESTEVCKVPNKDQTVVKSGGNIYVTRANGKFYAAVGSVPEASINTICIAGLSADTTWKWVVRPS